MSKLAWYWYRLRAMGPGEVGAHVAKRLRQRMDAWRLPDWSTMSLEPGGERSFPRLPPAGSAPDVVREALRRDAAEIVAGRWKAFGHLDLAVDVPPRWQKDYLAGVDLETDQSAFELSNRQQAGGADIKVIWEPSRWNQLVRLAQAAYVLDDRQAAETCVRWLSDWVEHNRAYRGLNWTSALETGLRLVQFAWIDALLSQSKVGAELARTGEGVAGGTRAGPSDGRSDPGEGRCGTGDVLAQLRARVLPAHVWFTWRYRSVGSSANNHLLGELAGLVLVLVRWPQLEGLAAPLVELQEAWEREVLAQFAGDGGNCEQALGYHLFSWEFCWQAQAALRAAGRRVSSTATQRLLSAARFYAQMKVDEWDYGDSDNAFVTPFCARETQAAEEWRAWFLGAAQGAAIRYWWGEANLGLKPAAAKPTEPTSSQASGLAGTPAKSWKLFRDSGYAVQRSGDWQLRWDLSPLGYLATAAHGHLDALHVSIWHRGVGFVIDPGTGAYYADRVLRDHLASWRAHNGPHPVGIEFPKRLGTFLWGIPHGVPVRAEEGTDALLGELNLPAGQALRTIRPAVGVGGWQVEDAYRPASGSAEFIVRWQFAPGALLEFVVEREFRVRRAGVTLGVQLDEGWSSVEWFSPNAGQREARGTKLEDLGEVPVAAVCSPAFRRVELGAYLLLTGKAGVSGVTTFTAVAG